MQQLLSIWSALDPRRRIVAVLATLAVIAAVLGLSRLAATPGMSLLYAGLEPGAAGEVIQALEQRSVGYEIRGDAIFVPDSQRDALRMTLAGEGLPANSTKGYELLDSLTGFGTTAQMFDAAYWRAKEGELARTIVAAPDLRTARVHIANPVSNPFRRDLRATASVSVAAAAGPISPQRARALRYLVASAVAGLDPADVSVIDAGTGIVVTGEEEAAQVGGRDRAELLRRNIERLLEARVGAGRAVVEVSVETVTEQEAITERRFDPEGRVAISSDTQERATTSTETGTGAVTVASNLPEGDVGGDGSSARSEDSETREVINYEVSEIRREVVRAPGAVRRISVAVLVDGIVETDAATGASQWRARPEEELGALRDLVASAIGFDAERGDIITLKSMEFRPNTLPVPADAVGVPFLDRLDPMRLIQVAVLALVALTLGLFVVRPVLRAEARPPAALTLPPADRVVHPELADGTELARHGDLIAPGAELPQSVLAASGADGPAALATAGAEGIAPLGDDPSKQDPVERLRLLIDERRDETVQILRSWMEDGEEAT